MRDIRCRNTARGCWAAAIVAILAVLAASGGTHQAVGQEFALTQIEMVFDNGRPDVMVPRNHPGLRAYAAVGFQGAGMFQAFWVADGRILGAATEYAMVDQATANEYQPLQ